MRPEKLNYILSSISSLKGVGPKLEQIINKLGIYKNIHFVWNIPNNILERKFYENIHDAEINSLVTLNLKIIKHEPSRFKRQPYKIKCICGDTNIDLVYFNARHPMLRQMLPTNENRLISGKLEYFRNTFQITHPTHVSALNNNKIIKSKEAVYSLTSGLNQKIMNKLTKIIGLLIAIAFLVGLATTLTRSMMIGFLDVMPVYILMGIAIFMMIYEAFFDKKN